ncbi:STAS-like domain-containing protein [Paracoccus fontiphilus]|uniref:STAS-like domain-containing protein n=1 Tax=Paracoccus fontiphilus TaxID=1815556 RepID=A0ABV7IHQ9_9RHOB|nr:STAS-like domain-containing protein [Paracoccus fontiphilus]
MARTINIAEQYTRFPGGRYPQDGDGNGTDFRIRFLLPVLEQHEQATVILDGAAGYPSSFLDEAFAGLVRNHGYSKDEVLAAFKFVADEPSFRPFVGLIAKYVREAKVPEGRVAVQ